MAEAAEANSRSTPVGPRRAKPQSDGERPWVQSSSSAAPAELMPIQPQSCPAPKPAEPISAPVVTPSTRLTPVGDQGAVIGASDTAPSALPYTW